MPKKLTAKSNSVRMPEQLKARVNASREECGESFSHFACQSMEFRLRVAEMAGDTIEGLASENFALESLQLRQLIERELLDRLGLKSNDRHYSKLADFVRECVQLRILIEREFERRTKVKAADQSFSEVCDNAREAMRHPLEQVRQLRMSLMALESPAYFMNDDFEITESNLAAYVLLGLSRGDLPIKADNFRPLFAGLFENFDEMDRRFDEEFLQKRARGETDWPRVDRELAIVKHKKYGRVEMSKVGIHVEGPLSSGWAVTYNIRSVENGDDYYETLREMTDAMVSWGQKS